MDLILPIEIELNEIGKKGNSIEINEIGKKVNSTGDADLIIVYEKFEIINFIEYNLNKNKIYYPVYEDKTFCLEIIQMPSEILEYDIALNNTIPLNHPKILELIYHTLDPNKLVLCAVRKKKDDYNWFSKILILIREYNIASFYRDREKSIQMSLRY